MFLPLSYAASLKAKALTPPRLLQVSAHMSPHKGGLSWHPYSSTPNSPPLLYFSPQHFTFTHATYSTCFCIYLLPPHPGCKLHKGRNHCPLCSWLFLQCLQTVALNKYSVNESETQNLGPIISEQTLSPLPAQISWHQKAQEQPRRRQLLTWISDFISLHYSSQPATSSLLPPNCVTGR